MTELLTKALADIAPKGGPGAILHLGAGQASEAAAYLASPARAIVLVEPQPGLAADLQARAAAEPRITLRQAAVAAKAGTAVMQRFNLAEMSSLRAPSLLRKLYPGLRQTETLKVPAVTFADLAKALPAAQPGVPDLLVIDVCGEEGVVIGALAARADRHRFGAVVVQAGVAALFEGAAEMAGIVAQMEAAAFRLRGQDLSDPDRPLLWFAPDAAALAAAHAAGAQASELAGLRTGLEAARAQAAEMKAELATLRNARTAAQAETAGLRTDLEAARAQAAEMKAELATLRNARTAAQAETAALRTDLEAARAQAAGMKAELATLRNARTAAQAETAALRTDLEAARDAACAERDAIRRILGESRAAHEARYDAQAEHLAACRAEAAALAAQVAGQQAELDSMQRRLTQRAQVRIAPDVTDAETVGTGTPGEAPTGPSGPAVRMIGPDSAGQSDPDPLRQKLIQTEAARAALAVALEQSRKDHGLAVARVGMARADAADLQQRLTAALALCHQQSVVVRDLTAALRAADASPPQGDKTPDTRRSLFDAVGE